MDMGLSRWDQWPSAQGLNDLEANSSAAKSFRDALP